MIHNSKINNLKLTIKFSEPLCYEYDSSTESVVLLDDYLYKVYYDNSQSAFDELIDLRQNIIIEEDNEGGNL